MNLADLKPGQLFSGIVKIVGKRTPGLVVLRVTDGSFSMDAVSRQADVEVGDVVELCGPAMRRLGKVQIEIKSISKTDKQLLVPVEHSVPIGDLVVRTTFNESKLKPLLCIAAQRIRQAIQSDQPVILRHHGDADGSCGAILLEKALQDLCRSMGLKPEYYVYRMPSKLPWYDVADALWDASFSKRVVESKGHAPPLIVVIDNGSTEEDVFALTVMNALGFSVVVIDHHHPGEIKDGKVAIDPFVEVHVNPLLVGGTYWSCSGMLCYEIAHLINPNVNLPVIAAIAAVADRSQSEEGRSYIEMSGKTIEELKELALCFDFLPYHLRTEAGTALFDAVLSDKDLSGQIVSEVNATINRQMHVLLPQVVVHNSAHAWLAVSDLGKLGERFSFPPAGKLTGVIHDTLKERNKEKGMTIGLVPGLIIIRATEPFFPVRVIIEWFKKAHPDILISGGGHDVAGTIKCPAEEAQKVINFIKNEMGKMK